MSFSSGGVGFPWRSRRAAQGSPATPHTPVRSSGSSLHGSLHAPSLVGNRRRQVRNSPTLLRPLSLLGPDGGSTSALLESAKRTSTLPALFGAESFRPPG